MQQFTVSDEQRKAWDDCGAMYGRDVIRKSDGRKGRVISSDIYRFQIRVVFWFPQREEVVANFRDFEVA